MELLILLLPFAVFFDLKSGKVPNRLLLPLAFGGPVQMLANHNITMAGSAVKGLVLIILLLFPFYRLRGLGAGDIKLLMFLPGYFPEGQWEKVVFGAFLIGAVIGVIKVSACYLLQQYQNRKTTEREGTVEAGCFPPGIIHFTIPIWISATVAVMR